MSQEDSQFLVNPYEDPVILKINGKASFTNATPVKELFDRLSEQGRDHFVIDFQHCSGMDSTFLGILAGLGIKLMKKEPKGSVVLCRLGARNRELIQNLGLHRILTVDDGEEAAKMEASGDGMEEVKKGEKQSEVENARLVLQAHENLLEVDDSNKTKFQDVIAFLKNQVNDR